MNRTLRVFGGVGLGQAHLVLVTLVGLWLTPFLLRHVGQHEYGLWLVGLQLVGYLQLLDLGVVALLPRETAYARGRVLAGDPGPIVREAVDRVRGVVRWQLPLVLAGAAGAWWSIPDVWSGLREPFAWVLAFFVITFPLRAYQAVLQGLQDLVFLGQVQIASWAAGTAVMVSLVLTGHGLRALAAGWLLQQLVSFAACGQRLHRRHADAWQRRAPRVPWSEASQFLGRSLWISAGQLAQVLLNGSDVLVIGALLGPAAVVPYACTAKLIQVLANHPQMLMQAAAPALSEMRMSVGRDRLASTTSALTRGTLVLSGGVASIVIAVNEPFVRWWVGPAQYGGLTLTVLLVAAMLARHLNTTTVYTIFCFGHERRTAVTALADGLVTVAVSAGLIRIAGLHGAALGSLVGVLAVSTAPNLLLVAREIGVKPLAPLVDLKGWFARFCACAAIAAGVAALAPSDGVLALAGRAALVAAVYGGVMLPYVMEGPLGGYLRQVLAPVLARLRTLQVSSSRP